MPVDVCPQCGRPLDVHDRDVRFRLPDPVLDSPEQERAAGVWTTDEDPGRAVMMQVPGLGGFVRCLLPVALTGGYTVTFGVWVGVRPDDLRRAFEIWWEPAYRDLTLEGRLANALPVWGLLAAPLLARVRDEDETPYVHDSADPVLRQVLTRRWPHEQVLAALPA